MFSEMDWTTRESYFTRRVCICILLGQAPPHVKRWQGSGRQSLIVNEERKELWGIGQTEYRRRKRDGIERRERCWGERAGREEGRERQAYLLPSSPSRRSLVPLIHPLSSRRRPHSNPASLVSTRGFICKRNMKGRRRKKRIEEKGRRASEK